MAMLLRIKMAMVAIIHGQLCHFHGEMALISISGIDMVIMAGQLI